jgi:TonB-linked SusC/RagA family outer membrane protein
LLVESGLVSYFGEVNYKYANKYILKFNARYDGSSRFGEERKYGFFPSASLGWRVSEESFLQDASTIDDLKLRASYGITGNERIGNFQFLGTWAAVTAYNGVPGLGPATLGNPDLGWEQTAEFNVGFDLSLWTGRVQVIFDYYYNLTEDLLLTEPLAFTTGFGSVLNNIGEVSNEGVEFTLNTVNIDKKLRWSTQFNISKNVNTVLQLASDEPIFSGYQTTPSSSTHIVTTAQPLGTFWGLKYLGVDPATGNAIYEDRNGDGQITGEDGQVIGNAQPDFVGGMTNNLYYGNFDLSFFFQFSYGNEMINFTKQGLIDNGANIQNNQLREALDRWQNEGDVTHIPKYEFGNTYNNYFSSRFVEDASYLRLKNVAVGYTIPEKIVSKARLSKLRIYVSGTNLWTLTNYTGVDPELNSLDGSTSAQGLDFFTLPQVRTILFGLNLGF